MPFRIRSYSQKTFITCKRWFLGTFTSRLVNILYLDQTMKTSTVETIQELLDKTGLSDEQIVKLGERLNHKPTQQYILENSMLSGTNSILTWLLGVIAFYLIFLIFSSLSPDQSFLKTTAVCSIESFSPCSFIQKRELQLAFPMSLVWVNHWTK